MRKALSVFLLICLIGLCFVGCGPTVVETSAGNIAEQDLTSTPEQLLDKYEFHFFSTLKLAVEASNIDDVEMSADSDREAAAVGVYDGGDHPYILLLKDHDETIGMIFSCAATLNLGGHKLHFSNRSLAFEMAEGITDTVTIDGRLTGSEITVDGNSKAAAIFRTHSGTLKVLGGKYVARDNSKTANVKGFLVDKEGKLYMSDCDIDALSHYIYDEVKVYGALSMAIDSKGYVELRNCSLFGTHSGMQTQGTLKINGGVFESIGHGGIYFSGQNAVSYVKNATIRQCDMPEGFEKTIGSNRAGFYIGGGEGDDGNTVYMDNCVIVAEHQPIVLRGSSNEKKNTLYISNSQITTGTTLGIRIDNNTHRLILGSGNSFGIEEVKLRPGVTKDDLSIMVTVTDEVYCTEY